MTSISRNVYLNKLDDMVNKYNNTYHNTIKMKSADIKSSTNIDSSKEINDNDPKFKVANLVRISKYKNIFAKGYAPNWSEKVFFVKKKLKTLCHVSMLLVILKAKKLLERFAKKNIEKNKSRRI